MLAFVLRSLSRLPLGFLYACAPLLYGLIYHVVRLRRSVVMDNLRLAFPDYTQAQRQQIASDFYRHYIDVVMEILKSFTISSDVLRQRVRFHGEELIADHLRQGRAILVTSAHQCNMQWLFMACCLRFDYPFQAIYRPMRSSRWERAMHQAYRRFCAQPIPERDVVKEMLQRRDEIRLVSMISDHSPNPGDDQHWVKFLNQDTGFFVGPETIAKFANYPVLFLAMRRERRGYYAVTVRELAIPPHVADRHLITERYAQAVEQQIKQDPADWLWVHQRWKHPKPLYS